MTTTSTKAAAAATSLEPLRELLSDVLGRLEALEGKGVGVGGTAPVSTNTNTAAASAAPGSLASLSSSSHHKASSARSLLVPGSSTSTGSGSGSGGEAVAVKAYDAYMKRAVIPFSKACDDVGLPSTMGPSIVQAWEGIRTVIVLASRSKAPMSSSSSSSSSSTNNATALQPYLTATHQAVQELLHPTTTTTTTVGGSGVVPSPSSPRALECHHKAVTELVTTLSWVLLQAPQQLPAGFVKESLSSVEFWTNRIRKDTKHNNNNNATAAAETNNNSNNNNSNNKHSVFCDTIKKVILELAEYIQAHHTTGLSFNAKSGISLAEAAIRLADEPTLAATDQQQQQHAMMMVSPGNKRHPTLGNVVVGGNVVGIIGELSKRKNADGTSAATGLKHVNKDQQTWRKEFKKDDTKIVLPPAPSLEVSQTGVKKKEKKKLTGLPIFEYQDRGFKWVIENHSKESVIKETSHDGVVTVEISDPKQQVYLYNCNDITVKVNGKFKSLVLDKCEGCAVVYDTLISSAEMVNCKKIQLQVNGVCPVFTIDKTVNVLIWLSKESVDISNFTTSLSSEMNVSFPDGDDQKEVPIPEQYVHKLVAGKLKSEVSDLYN